jgi:hypothetical protein
MRVLPDLVFWSHNCDKRVVQGLEAEQYSSNV